MGEGLASGRLAFVHGAAAAVRHGGDADVVFLCVPTPMGVGGVADLAAVESVLEEVRELLARGAVVVNKPTVPVGTTVRTAELLARDDIAASYLSTATKWASTATTSSPGCSAPAPGYHPPPNPAE